MLLTTPDTIRTLQRKLYAKAKQQPAYRFQNDGVRSIIIASKLRGSKPGRVGKTSFCLPTRIE